MEKISNNCSGCGACISLCRHGAVRLVLNNLGEEVAVIDQDKCIGCGLCKKKCPQESDVKGIRPSTCFASWTKNQYDYHTTSSGGIATLLCRRIIKMGGVVYGAAYLPTQDVTHIRIENEKELDKIKGSKYVQSTIVQCYKLIKQDLEEGRMVLFIGTPCQIAGIEAVYGENEKLITVDLVCHGTPPREYLKEYITSMVPSNGKDTKVAFREKKYWLSIYQEGSCIYHQRYNRDPYFLSFMNNEIFRENCYSCKYANVKRVSDITLGDFWGIKKLDTRLSMPEHVSCVLINTLKGETLFSSVKEECYSEEMLIEDAVKGNWNLHSTSMRPKLKDDFNRGYINGGFMNGLKETAVENRIARNKIRDVIMTPYRIFRYGKNYRNLL
ncbi:MAG: Coenzyme F420 hydrogenase/dehydrogenase, beta subunit C-terminal domain [bacterium]|nr:Coenzyme F420 hydrogenase/dehydrogenase, beta subunit C-terminal domain [bacterium]